MRYHLTEAGPKRCVAKKGCPLKGEHFDSEASAYQAFEALQEDYSVLSKNTKKLFQDHFESAAFDEAGYRSKAQSFLQERTTEEIDALKGYVISDYDPINSALYSGKRKNTTVASLVRNLDSALEKAPEAPTTLWRSLSGFDLPKDFIAASHKVGDVIQFKGFVSTSETVDALMHIPSDVSIYMKEHPDDDWPTDPNFKYRVVAPEEYTDGAARNVLLKINAKKAAPVSALRDTVAEQEWLLPRGKKFKVRAIHQNVDISDLENIRNRGTRAQIFELEEV